MLRTNHFSIDWAAVIYQSQIIHLFRLLKGFNLVIFFTWGLPASTTFLCVNENSCWFCHRDSVFSRMPLRVLNSVLNVTQNLSFWSNAYLTLLLDRRSTELVNRLIDSQRYAFTFVFALNTYGLASPIHVFHSNCSVNSVFLHVNNMKMRIIGSSHCHSTAGWQT